MKKYLLGLFVLFSFSLYAINQSEINDLRDSITPKIIYLECQTARGWHFGTAFTIREDGLILTAKHATKNGSRFIGYWRDGEGNNYTQEAILIAEHPQYDAALLKLNLPAGFSIPYFEFEDNYVKTNQWVYFGFFNIQENRVLLRGGKILNSFYSNELMPEIYSSLPTFPGDSGGPWFQQDGKIIGIHVGARRNDENSIWRALFLPYYSIKNWLTEITNNL